MSVGRISDLVALLANTNARVDERDDAAMDLAASDDPAAVQALLDVGRRRDENETLLSSIGESLAQISLRAGKVQRSWLTYLAPPAAAEFTSNIRASNPALLDD